MLEQIAAEAGSRLAHSFGLAGVLILVFVGVLAAVLWFTRSVILRQQLGYEADMAWARGELDKKREEFTAALKEQHMEFVQALDRHSRATEQALARLETFWARRLDAIEDHLHGRPANGRPDAGQQAQRAAR